MKQIIKIPDSNIIKKQVEVNSDLQKNISKYRKEIKSIINRNTDKKIVIVWPCSVDFKESIMDYAYKLKEIYDKVKDKVFVILRLYTAKPRTTVGWKWVLYNWEFWTNWNLLDWIIFVRNLMIEIAKMWLPVADEVLYPNLIPYFDDLVSYYAIWARSSENQHHREVASALDIPVWIKNNTCWDLNNLVNSLFAVKSSQQAVINNTQYETYGNKYAHVILRWANINWESILNFDPDSIKKLVDIMQKKNILSPIIIDLNHDNSWKQPLKQIDNFQAINKNPNKQIIGYMIESYIYTWNQQIDDTNIIRWKSITDPCLGIEETEKLIYMISK